MLITDAGEAAVHLVRLLRRQLLDLLLRQVFDPDLLLPRLVQGRASSVC